ncbi:MAG: hypothetical protein KAT34_09425 [Candidatus Aminicenantes bacterium]|nr:hypothetical protein [Candidatus Aminicenantes bacterium]
MENHYNRKLKTTWDRFGGTNLLHVPLAEINRTIYDLLNQNKQAVIIPAYRLAGCMDEGAGGKSVGLGGPGIVLAFHAGTKQGKQGWQAVLAGLDTTARVLDGDVDAVSSHDGCGACGIVYDLLSGEEQKQFADSDRLGVALAKELAEKLSVDYKHIPYEEMTRQASGHTARMVFYTGTEQFNIDDCLPRGIAFTVSRGSLQKLEDKEFAAEIGKFLLDTACRIATGDHGLAELATSLSPFVIVPAAGSRVSLPILLEESREIAAKYPGNVTVLDGFSL